MPTAPSAFIGPDTIVVRIEFSNTTADNLGNSNATSPSQVLAKGGSPSDRFTSTSPKSSGLNTLLMHQNFFPSFSLELIQIMVR